MKPLLAALVAFGIGLALLLALAGAQSTPQDFDYNGDGVVNGLDLAVFAGHFLEVVGTPEPCVPGQHFATPQLVYSIDGTPIAAVVNRIAIPTDDSRYLPNLAGTQVRVVPC